MDFKYINTEYLEMVAGGDSDLLKELIGMFRDQVIEFNSELKEHFAGGDHAAMGNLAHKAKSSVAIMGMDSLANMLKTFEIEAKDGKNAEKYESYIKRFEDETRHALEELDELVNNRQL
jgi:HPt (histidine-containing phosphotransfer) domain-containing protein